MAAALARGMAACGERPEAMLFADSGSGRAQAEVVGIGEPPEDDGDDRPLLVPLVERGEVVGRETLEEARARHLASRAELPRTIAMMSAGEPVIPTVHVGG